MLCWVYLGAVAELLSTDLSTVQVAVPCHLAHATAHKKEPPLLGVSGGGSVVRGDKIQVQESRTVSVYRSCRGCVVVFAHLYIDKITIRLLYLAYTIEASPVNGL